MDYEEIRRRDRLQAAVVRNTSELYDLGYTIKCTYVKGAGWASELIDKNTGELNKYKESKQ